MSQYLDTLKVGDTVDIRGPAGKLTYLGRGEFFIDFNVAKNLLNCFWPSILLIAKNV